LFPDSTKKLSESGIIKMLNFLSDKIFALFGGPTRKLLKQGVIVVKLKSSLRMLSGCQHDLIKRYGISESQSRKYYDKAILYKKSLKISKW
jgi:hypothetical protein